MKPKWKETEFWVLLLGIIATIAGYLGNQVEGNTAVVVLAIQSAAYTAYRQLAKRSPTDDQLRQAVFGAMLHAESYRKNRGDGGNDLPRGVPPNPKPPAGTPVGGAG